MGRLHDASRKTLLALALLATSAFSLSQPRDNLRPSYDCTPGDSICERGSASRDERGSPGRPSRFDRADSPPRGAGPDHAFRPGGRLPNTYRSRTYVVDDWRGHGLRQPPRGYHWVQTGGDYVLAAIASGLILELMLSR
jgi:Ni/Co efflux regulator RcnB